MVCPITYRPISGGQRYSPEGLRKLSPNLRALQDLPFTAEEQLREAAARASKMSIQGVQPKLSARLSVARESFAIVDIGGRYILKPQNPAYPRLPENEDLSMRLAETVGIEVPLHGLLYSKDQSMTYFIERFDRQGRAGKLALEDFAQLLKKSRETKYDSSMEQVVRVIEEFCTFPAVEKVKLLRLTLFNYLIGNEDMHLKNYSLIRRDSKIELSPAYDLLNTSIVLRDPEEIALPLHGRKRNLTASMFLEYFAQDRLQLLPAVIKDLRSEFTNGFVLWDDLIGNSFLPEDLKQSYRRLIEQRRGVLTV